MPGGKEADIRARLAEARDRVDGHVPVAGPENILVEEVSVQQNHSSCARAQSLSGRAGFAEACETSLAEGYVAACPPFIGGVISGLFLGEPVDRQQARKSKGSRRYPVQPAQQFGRDLGGGSIVAGRQWRPRPD